MSAVTITSPTVVTVATRSPAMISGTQREVHPEQAAPPRVAHAVGGLGDVALHRIKAADDAPDQDQQRVADQRNLGGQTDRPVTGTRNASRARLGIV